MELTSPRLILRPLKGIHLEQIHVLWTCPGVRQYLWDNEIIPLSQTADILDKNEQLFSEHQYGLWGGWDKNSDQLMGFAGFWYFRDPPELEILYGVAEDRWGQGFATELAQVIIDYGFNHLHFAEIIGSTDTANQASWRVMENLGFHFKKRETINNLDTLFYELRRELSRNR